MDPRIIGLEDIYDILHALADIENNYDHFTIMKFTTGWKLMPYTPDLSLHGREEVWNREMHKDFIDGLKSMKFAEDYPTGIYGE